MQAPLASSLLRGVASFALLPASIACSHDVEPAPPADSEPAPNLGELFALGQYDAIVSAAPTQLSATRDRGATPAECWEIERIYLLALAHTGPADRLVECWTADSLEFAETIPPEFLFELHRHVRPASTDEDLLQRLVLATSDAYRTRWVAWMERMPTRNANDPYGHPEGFPRAWLAPDERPHEPDDP